MPTNRRYERQNLQQSAKKLIEGGVEFNNATPSINKSNREYNFDIVDTLCGKFMGLSPFEVLNMDFSEVMSLYVDCIIHDYKEKNGNKEQGDVWVTSENATWH